MGMHNQRTWGGNRIQKGMASFQSLLVIAIFTIKLVSASESTVDNLTVKEKRVLDRVSDILDKTDDGMSLTEFQATLASTSTLSPDLREWTKECSLRSQEMFRTLDVTNDALVSRADFDTVSKQGLRVFLARMEDRFADLDDIMSDQKVDFILDNEKAVPRNEMRRQILKLKEEP